MGGGGGGGCHPGRRQSRVDPEGEWDRVKVPRIRRFGVYSSAPTPSFAPGCDLPEATTPCHSLLRPTWWGPQRYFETDQHCVSKCWALLSSFQIPPVPGVVRLRRGPAGVKEEGLIQNGRSRRPGVLGPRTSSWWFSSPCLCGSHARPPAG